MNFKVDKSELVRILEVILETQHPSEDDWFEQGVYYEAERMLKVVENVTVSDNVYISEEQALMISEFC